MGKHKTLLRVAAFVILQLVLSFAHNRLFVQDMRASVDAARQRMREDGVSLAANSHSLSALDSMTISVASYVTNVTTFVIIMNGVMLLILLRSREREEGSG